MSSVGGSRLAAAIRRRLSRLATEELQLDEIAADLARERNQGGVALAREAGFEAIGRVSCGKPWRTICDVADELGTEPIVLGARGLGRAESTLLGSVSAAVVTHARCPVVEDQGVDYKQHIFEITRTCLATGSGGDALRGRGGFPSSPDRRPTGDDDLPSTSGGVASRRRGS